ncbi:hypothetical protein [Nesterenkonia muleiensis]|uniref:hypothetical protein n=1 Tax=Nesterenkonia muleiensis TaxID=2282648 RepID=UPI000E760BFC|nr:hypothetical protein [Nesterenkonia muleiensis]
MSRPIDVHVRAMSNADALGYLGQQEIARAVGDGGDYRIVGGHMVRLLLQVYPTANAELRSTLDADAAVDDVRVIGSISESLIAQNFTKSGGNLYFKMLDSEQRVEVNLLLSRHGPAPGMRTQYVPGIGEVDTLPELSFVLSSAPLLINVTAALFDGQTVEYTTRIPDLEAALVHKAHSWKGRNSKKDLVDLHSLLEVREAHPDVPWRLGDDSLIGFRKDSAGILHQIAQSLTRKSTGIPVPAHINRLRMAALISKHITRP